MTDRASAEGLREALEIIADALDAAAEDAHAGWAYYGGAPGPESPHSGPDDFNKCEDSQCRLRQRYVEDARAVLRDYSDHVFSADVAELFEAASAFVDELDAPPGHPLSDHYASQAEARLRAALQNFNNPEGLDDTLVKNLGKYGEVEE